MHGASEVMYFKFVYSTLSKLDLIYIHSLFFIKYNDNDYVPEMALMFDK